jgi:hypothetical protein
MEMEAELAHIAKALDRINGAVVIMAVAITSAAITYIRKD